MLRPLPRTYRPWRAAVLLGTAALCVACNNDSGPAPAVAISAHAGAAQQVVAGSAVAVKPAVKVTDASGKGVANVSVTFAVASGGGSVTGETQTTDAEGIATVGGWTLGTAAGTNTLTATSNGLTGSPVTFTATGVAGAPSVVAIQAGDAQTTIARGPVAVRPAVKVTDANGNNASGTVVTFAVTSGGGTVTGATPTTDINGVATVGAWNVGVGANTLTATVANLPSASVTFTATGTIGPAFRISPRAGNSQTAVAGTDVPTRPSITVTDVNGNAVASVAVQFAVASGGGSVTGASQVTDANGVATVGSWTLGTTAGTNTLSVTAPGTSLSPATIVASGTAGAPASFTIVSGNNQSATAGTLVPLNPAVRIADANGNGVPNLTVTFAVASGGGTISGASPVTGTNGVATVGSWTLGSTSGTNTLTATASGVRGSPATFSATGLAASLVGLFNAGGGGGGVWQFVRVNSETGAQTVIATVPNLASVQDGESAIDAGALRYYFIGTDNTGAKRIYTLNATTGAVIASPVLTSTGVVGIEFDFGSRQIMSLAQVGGVLQFARTDPATGNVSFGGAVQGLSSVQAGDVTSDPPNSRYIFVGLDAAGTKRLYSVNSSSFAIVTQPALGNTPIAGIQLDPRSGAVLGISLTGSTADFVRVDVTTGAITSFGVVSGVTSIDNNATLGPANFRYFITGNDPAHRLISIDPQRGTVLGRPAVGSVVLLQGLP